MKMLDNRLENRDTTRTRSCILMTEHRNSSNCDTLTEDSFIVRIIRKLTKFLIKSCFAEVVVTTLKMTLRKDRTIWP